MPELPPIARARGHAGSIAFRTPQGATTYQELLDRSASLATTLLAGAADLREARVALLAPAGPDYVAAQWGLWRAGGVKVPICLTATEPEWEYALTDSGASAVLADAASARRIAPLCARLGLRLIDIEAHAEPAGSLPELTPARRAMILYTSGTTSRPKGV
ncbi:MAG: AMP-binding protein, partial [Opitutia bacterium]